MLLLKLIALLKKDAILATRSKVWTLFELLLPVLILFAVDGMTSMMSKQLTPEVSDRSRDDTIPKNSDKEGEYEIRREKLPVFHETPTIV